MMHWPACRGHYSHPHQCWWFDTKDITVTEELVTHVHIARVVIIFSAPPLYREEPDELLAHIDDMLADLNTELDFMIPGTDV